MLTCSERLLSATTIVMTKPATTSSLASYEPEALTDNSLEWRVDSADVSYVMRTIGERHLTGITCAVVIRGREAKQRLWWGFSGLNAFEGDVLQPMVAAWVRADVGDLTFVASPFHLYDRHHRQAGAILNRFRGVTCHQHGLLAPAFTVELTDLDRALSRTFEAERRVCFDPQAGWELIGDSFLDGRLGALRRKHAAEAGMGRQG